MTGIIGDLHARAGRFQTYWNRRVWERETKDLAVWRRFIVHTLRLIQAVARDLADGQLSLQAMSLVYTTVISLVPLLALCFSVLKGFGAHNAIKPALLNALEPLGDKRFEVVERVIQFVDNVQVGVLGAAGLALLIYSVVSMMQKIERSFNYTWHVTRGRSFAQRFSDYLSVLLLGPLLIFLSVGMTASARSNAAVQWLSAMPALGTVLEWLGFIVPYFIMAAAFAFIYTFMPHTKVNLGPAFVGGLVTAVIWKTMGWLFTAFVAGSSSHTAVYSAFASIIIFMVWLYVGWLMLLVGASVAFYCQNRQSVRYRRGYLRLSNRVKEKLALAILYLIAKNYHADKKPWTLETLSGELGVPLNVIETELSLLVASGFLVAARGSKMAYYPAHPLERIKLYHVLDAIRCSGETKALDMRRVYAGKPVDDLFAEMNDALRERLGNTTLKQIVKS